VPVNILRTQESDEANTFVPRARLPVGRGIGTFDIDYLPDPQPLSLWMDRYVPQSEETEGFHIQTGRSGPVGERSRGAVLSSVSIFTCPHHGIDFVAAGGGTVTLVEAIREKLVSKDEHNVVSICYQSVPSSTEQDFPLRTMDISPQSRRALAEPLPGYEAYSVENWDGYDASPITPETLAAARAILKALPKKAFGEPECSPGADGSIGLEWIMDRGPVRKLFIDIGPGRTWKAYWRFANGQTDTIPRKRISLGTIRELTTLFERLGCVNDALEGW
jgi:hypothetical protein